MREENRCICGFAANRISGTEPVDGEAREENRCICAFGTNHSSNQFLNWLPGQSTGLSHFKFDSPSDNKRKTGYFRIPSFFCGAREENRTPTTVATRPSNVPVYLFQHSRVSRSVIITAESIFVNRKFYFVWKILAMDEIHGILYL